MTQQKAHETAVRLVALYDRMQIARLHTPEANLSAADCVDLVIQGLDSDQPADEWAAICRTVQDIGEEALSTNEVPLWQIINAAEDIRGVEVAAWLGHQWDGIRHTA